ncbi:MAG: hypothetical protein IJ679_06000 [Lachnospiraceae bacterium]|nr:hypothetical protein [Lachnospiraceae bacterium]
MSKSEVLHRLYEECQDIDFMDTHELAKRAKTEEEADFIRMVIGYLLKKRQEKAILEKRF